MDPIWITVAFIFGFFVRFFNLPPLVGYLLAGFFLSQIGAESGEFILILSDLGVLLLLFTIGLKFKVSDLLRKEIWASTLVYSFISTVLYGAIIFIFSSIILLVSTEFNLIMLCFISFALSFSSTVFSIKTLEDKGEVQSFHGRISIGVLIVQDILAVILMAILYANNLSFWILSLPIILFVVRPILLKILDWIGHGELLVLYGLFLALVLGPESFKLLGLKADLGALVFGMLVSKHYKANEMAKILMNFKDIFLIGFFLSIGLSGLPTKPILMVAGIITLLLPIKSLLYFLIFTKFRLRSRTSFHSTATLTSFSEFGLIITVSGISIGIIDSVWMTIMAIILSLSYIISSPLTSKAHQLYPRFKRALGRFESLKRLDIDKIVNIGDSQILVFGMGRVGNSVYDQLTLQYGKKVLGIDFDEDVVNSCVSQGKKVIQDDATDSEFWETIYKTKPHQVNLVMFCFHDYKNILYSVKQLTEIGFNGTIAALAEFDDQINHLKELGVTFPFNFYSETGIGFADSVCDFIDKKI